MSRFALLPGIAVALGVAVVAAAACTGGGNGGEQTELTPAPSQQPAVYLSLGDSSVQGGCCGDRGRPAGSLFRQYLAQRLNRSVEWITFARSQTTDEFIHGVGGEASQLDRAIDALTSWRREGRPYVYEHADVRNSGEEPIAMVDFFFDPPVSYAGEVAAIVADPCRGHGVEGRLDPSDPCVDQPREYGTEYREFIDAQHVTAEIDFRSGEVVEVFQSPVAWQTMDYFRMQYEQ